MTAAYTTILLTMITVFAVMRGRHTAARTRTTLRSRAARRARLLTAARM